jgi:hypothetical protein
LAFNYYQWKSQETHQAFLGRQLAYLGSNLFTANFCLQNILSGQLDKGYQYGRGSEALMGASRTASELASPSYSKHYLTWHKIYTSLEHSAISLQELSRIEKLNETETAKLNNITKLVDVYINVMKKANLNNGYLDELSINKADQAAEVYYQSLK